VDFATYQAATDSTAIYPGAGRGSPSAINYNVLALAGEAGEIAGKWSKYYRDGLSLDVVLALIREELGDVLWHLARLAREIEYDFDDVALDNLDKLENRKRDGTLTGFGDHR
jgi:NTP pyrophosphatase (non-canonical NTP hydrolase)